MGRYRAALVGCGLAGSLVDAEGPSPLPQSHAGMYSADSRFELVAACDPDAVRLQAFERTWKPRRAYANVHRMLDEESLDVVSIATPTGTHAEVLEATVRAGVPVVVLEKPVAQRVADVETVQAIAATASTKILVNYQRRWSSNFVRLARYLHDGALGDVVRVQVNYPVGLVHGGSHAIDLLRWFFGPIQWVQAVTQLEAEASDGVVDCLFGWPNGLRAYFQGFERRPWNVFEVDLLGTAGRVRITQGGREMEFFTVAQDPDYPRLAGFVPQPAPFPNDWQSAYLNLAEHVIELLDEPTSRPHCSFQDGLLALRVAEAALVSAREGCREVRL